MNISPFEFTTSEQIIFGAGQISRLGILASRYGERLLLVTGKAGLRWPGIMEDFENHNLLSSQFVVAKEPTISLVEEGVEQARRQNTQVVIAVGGGSVIDTGKAIAALLTNGGQPLDYLEVIGKGEKLDQPSAPFIAVPTTAGTGAEVTRNAVLASPENRVKVSLRSAYMLPTIALVDPELTYGLPPSITASSGLDALTQVLEPIVSNQADPLVDAICWDGLERGARALPRLQKEPDDKAARDDLALVSLYGGLALANSKLGAVHGIAGPFGGMFDAAHGAVCARLLPAVFLVNAQVLQQRQPDDELLGKFHRIARTLTGDPLAAIVDGADWLEVLVDRFEIPRLGSYGFTKSDYAALIEKSGRSSSMKGNAVKLRDDEITQILEMSR